MTDLEPKDAIVLCLLASSKTKITLTIVEWSLNRSSLLWTPAPMAGASFNAQLQSSKKFVYKFN